MQTPRRNRRKETFKFKGLYIFTSILALTIIVLCINLISIRKKIESITISESNKNIQNQASSQEEQHTTPEEDIQIPTVEGQKLATNADGYNIQFTTFDGSKTYTEYKQFLGSWAPKTYNEKTIAEAGSDLTSLAIIASGYGKNVTPDTLRDEYRPHLNEDKITSALTELGIKCNDFSFSISEINKKYISEWLSSGKPVLIYVDKTRENIWTTDSQYMALLDISPDGTFYLSNPNGEDGTETASGWYSASDIIPFVVKAAFIEGN